MTYLKYKIKHWMCYLSLLLLLACGSTQKASNQIESGNYIEAFNTSVAQLNKDKTKKSNQKLIPLLKDAYTKAANQDRSQIKNLQAVKSLENLKKIYGFYLNLDIRQDEVRALSPLYFGGIEQTFNFQDYSSKIKTSKKVYADALFKEATESLKGDQLAARRAFKHLEDLIYIYPDYRNDLNTLLQQAKNKGSSFVYVELKNRISTLSNDSLIDFTKLNTSNFSNTWLVLHNKKERNRNYDYLVEVNFDKILIEPEKTLQETVPQEAKIQDGYQYQLDAGGNVMKDDKGNDIKIAKYVVVKAEVTLFQQNKALKLEGAVLIKNLGTNKNLHQAPEFGEAKFQHTYAQYRGDQRAIEQKYFEALKAKALPYPKDHEFLKYAILNFKQKLTGILSEQAF